MEFVHREVNPKGMILPFRKSGGDRTKKIIRETKVGKGTVMKGSTDESSPAQRNQLTTQRRRDVLGLEAQ